MSRVQSISSRVLKRTQRAFSTKPPVGRAKPAPAPTAKAGAPSTSKPAATAHTPMSNETKPSVFIPVTFGLVAALAYYYHNNKEELSKMLEEKFKLAKNKDAGPLQQTPIPPLKPKPTPESKPAPVVAQENEDVISDKDTSAEEPKDDMQMAEINNDETALPEAPPGVDVIIFDEADVVAAEAAASESTQNDDAKDATPVDEDSDSSTSPSEGTPEDSTAVDKSSTETATESTESTAPDTTVPAVAVEEAEPEILESVTLVTPPPEDFIEESKEKARQRARQLLLDEVTQILEDDKRKTDIDEVLELNEKQLRAKVLRLLEINAERAKAEALRLAQFSEENNKRWQGEFAAFVESAKKQMQEQAKVEAERERSKLVASLQTKFDEEVALAREEIEKLSRSQLEAAKSELEAKMGAEADARRQQLLDLQSRLEATKTVIADHNNFAAESTRVHRLAFGVLGFSHAVSQAFVDPGAKGPIREYAALKATGSDDPVINAALNMVPEALVKNGIPSMYQLQTQFNKIKREGRADVISKHGTGYFGQAMGFAFTSVLAPIQSGFDKLKESAAVQTAYIKESVSEVTGKVSSHFEFAKPVIDPVKNFVRGTYNNIQVPKPNVRGVVDSIDQATTGADEIKSQVKNIAQDTLQKAGEFRSKTATLASEARAVNVIFENAELAIARGDLRTAIALLKTLKGEEGVAVKSWMEQAQLRVDVQDAVDVMIARANLLVFSLY